MRLIAMGAALFVLVGADAVARAEEGWPPQSDLARRADLDAPVPQRARVTVRASAGGSSRALFDALVAGGEGGVGAGLDTPVGTFGLAVGFFGGVVEGGFTMLQGTFGFDAEWTLGVVRIGVEPRVGYLQFDRLTTERDFGAYTFGVAGRFSVDVLRDEGIAVAIGVRPTAEVAAAFGNDGRAADAAAPLLGGSAFAEVRWRGLD